MKTCKHHRLALLLLVAAGAGCRQEPAAPEAAARLAEPTTGVATSGDSPELRPRVEAFCGGCHHPPRPESFPRHAWRLEVERGYDFYEESLRDDLDPPPKEAVVAFYEALAPAALHVDPPESERRSAVRFEPRHAPIPPHLPPAVSYITWRSLRAGDAPQLIFADMRSGELRAMAPTADGMSETALLGRFAHPAHVETCDLDGDQQIELVVAELGSARSADHSRGGVYWLRREGDRWVPRLLFSGIGRVADMRPGDLDGDGDDDLLVAEFGHFRTGSIFWLENRRSETGAPQFVAHTIDDRHGTIHVPLTDLDGDGDVDFVALISQEYETVEAFVNDGRGSFSRELIFAGRDPAFGSSGIQLVDLDGDGDTDVLYTNGDTFGSEQLKPYHGIHWLENEGTFPFTARRLARMVGVQKALAGDLDGDGDLDVAAVALMPRNLLSDRALARHHSVVWLEQTAPGAFRRHAVEQQRFYHAALELADVDRDGDLDLAIGNMYPDDSPLKPWLTIWENGGAVRGEDGAASGGG